METRVKKEEREPSYEGGETMYLCAQDSPARRKEDDTLRYPHTCLGIVLRSQDTSAQLVKHLPLQGQSEKMQVDVRTVFSKSQITEVLYSSVYFYASVS